MAQGKKPNVEAGQPADDLFRDIVDAISRLRDPDTLSNRQEFMEAGVEAMDALLNLAKLAVCLERPKGRGYTRRHAPIVGLMVRMIKLFEGMLDQIVKQRSLGGRPKPANEGRLKTGQ